MHGLRQAARSGKDVVDWRAVVDCQPFTAWNLECTGVESKLLQDRGMNIRDIMAMFHSMETEFVGRAVYVPALDSAAGHPHREGKGVVVATIGAL